MFRSSDRRGAGDPDVTVERLAGRVNLLAERVDTLSQTVASTAAATAKKDGEIAVLRRELDGVRAHVDAAATSSSQPPPADEVRELRNRVAALASERARSSDDSRISTLESRSAHLAERIDTLATTVATTAAGLAGRDGEIAALRHRFDEAAATAADAPMADGSLRKRIDDLGAAAASASMRLDSHSTQIAALRDALDARQDTLESALALLAERVESAERERATLATSVAEAAGNRWRELDRAIASLGERLDGLELGRTEIAAAFDRAASLWPAALRSLEVRLGELARAVEQPQPARPGPAPPRPAAHAAAAPTQPAFPDVQRFLSEIRALESRLESTEADARHERDELRGRLRRLEVEHGSAPPEVSSHAGADVLPLRSLET